MSILPHLVSRRPSTPLLEALYPTQEATFLAPQGFPHLDAVLADGADPNESGTFRVLRIDGPVRVFTQHRGTPLELATRVLRAHALDLEGMWEPAQPIVHGVARLLEAGATPTYQATEFVLAALEGFGHAIPGGVQRARREPTTRQGHFAAGLARGEALVALWDALPLFKGAPLDAAYSRKAIGLPPGTYPDPIELSGWEALEIMCTEKHAKDRLAALRSAHEAERLTQALAEASEPRERRRPRL